MPLQPDQIEIVREIIGTISLSEITTRAASQSPAQDARTLDDIAQWEKYRNKFSKLKGGRLGLEKDPEEARVEIRNRVRERFGYPRLDKYGQVIDSQSLIFPSCTVTRKPTW